MNYLYAAIVAIIILFGVEQWGEHVVQVKWDQDVAVREALLAKTKQENEESRNADKLQYEKDQRAATSKAGRDAIARFLRDHGLLPNGDRVQPITGDVQAPGQQGTDGTPEEPGTSGALERFATDCALDALQVMRWQDMCKANRCEVAE